MKKLILLAAILSACAAPASEQGRSAQGGAVNAPPLSVTFNVGTGGGITTTNTSAPTAAPASTSTATSEQTATADVRAQAALGDSAIKAVAETYAAAIAAGKTAEEASAAALAAGKAALAPKPVPKLGDPK